MDLGIYFDLRNPPQWSQDPKRLYGFTLEMCEEAEQLGISSIWFSEHHLFEDGYLPQPLIMAAAAAARTRRVRIGTAVLVAPFRSAVEIAEQATIVDLISGGRLDLGLGAGYRVPEFELFDIQARDRYAMTKTRIRELRQIWQEERVTPRPVQEQIPIWLGYNGPKGARTAGRLGERLLSANAELWEPYRLGLAESGFSEDRGSMAGLIQAFVTETPEADWATVANHLKYQLDSYRRYAVEGTGASVPRPVRPDDLLRRPMGSFIGYFVHGTPEDVTRAISSYTAGAPVQTVFLFVSIAGMPEELVARHVRIICTRLRPLLEPLGQPKEWPSLVDLETRPNR
jgi:alkanesulfonate monooxygenase SsuD/methylene tetrahydromethanopterin reductase-like flavin-dependent oxidoreductase (luciferase family)